MLTKSLTYHLLQRNTHCGFKIQDKNYDNNYVEAKELGEMNEFQVKGIDPTNFFKTCFAVDKDFAALRADVH